MMSAKLPKVSSIRSIGHRLLASQAAPKEGHHHHEFTKPQPLKVKTLPSGMIVAAQETYSPLARVAVCFRAGTRYEPEEDLGLVHTLRNAAGLSTKKATCFGITRNIEFVGGRLYAIVNRDMIMYVLENIRDYTMKNLEFVSQTIQEPAFKPWELSDFEYRQKVDLALMRETPQLWLMEALHQVAFRGGLRNSLFTPECMLGKHTHEKLMDYVKNHFVAKRAAVVGLGIDHNELLDYVGKNLPLQSGDRGNSGASKYVGGEIRIDTNSDLTHVAVVAEGVGAKNQKEALALNLFQALLGTGPRVKYSHGASTVLGAAAAKVAENPFAVSSVNINHADLGLFGFMVSAHPKEVHKIVKAVVSQLRESAKKVTEENLKNAKNNLKATLLVSLEDRQVLLEDLATQLLVNGQASTHSDIEKAIDSVSVQDVVSAAAKAIKGKGAMAAIGKLYNTPYLEDLA